LVQSGTFDNTDLTYILCKYIDAMNLLGNNAHDKFRLDIEEVLKRMPVPYFVIFQSTKIYHNPPIPHEFI